MRARALENLRAAEVLVAVDPPCANAAISRAYYAVYHTGWFLLEEQGDEPPEYDGRRYWRHDDFSLYLFRATILDEDGREFMEGRGEGSDSRGAHLSRGAWPGELARTMGERAVMLRSSVLALFKAQAETYPIRWADGLTSRGDFEGREHTVEFFNVPVGRQRELRRKLRDAHRAAEGLVGRPILLIFHTPEATAAHYHHIVEGVSRIENALLNAPLTAQPDI